MFRVIVSCYPCGSYHFLVLVLFQIYSNGSWYYFCSWGRSFIEGLLDSIKNWKNKFIWLNSARFSYRNVFLLLGTIIDEKIDKTPNLRQNIDKIYHFNVVMKKFPGAVLGKVGMSPYWICTGAIPSLFVLGSDMYYFFPISLVYLFSYIDNLFISFFSTDGSWLPFVLFDFVEGKISPRDIRSDDFGLPIFDDIMNDNGNEGINSGDDEDDEEET